ncbi:hypothetical protein DFH05DRAFT_1460468 [Lentinula detonsa]|nr:hypothetical protein DFH05DRAFT_1460468 [Lentinula detonsa]
MGRLWSDVKILEYQLKKKAEKAQEEVEKEERKRQRFSKKALKHTIDVEWEAIKQKHNENLEKWVATCAQLKEKGVKARDLPRKPTHETKNSLIERLSGTNNKESEEETEDE